MRTTHIAAAAVALLATTSSAWAASGWDTAALGYSGNGLSSATPWIASPAAGSSYAEWNAFNSLPTDSTPDIAGAGSVTEYSGTSFLTGGGNIYSFSSATDFTVTLGGATGGTWDVYLRVASLGTSPAEQAFLNGVAATRVITFSGSAAGGFGGLEEESLWHWTVSGASSYAFDFNSVSSSLSLDQLAVYAVQQAAPVPEPGTWAMVLGGLAAVGLIARKQRRA